MIILGIDPGIEKIGYAFFDKNLKDSSYEFITSGLIKTQKTDEHATRLLHIYSSLISLIKTHKPDAIVIEQLFFAKNQKTVIGVAQAQGVIVLLAAQSKIPLTYLTPLQIKSIITGYGQADKKSVQKMLGYLMKGKLQTVEDDESDAVACSLAYCILNTKLI